MGQARRLRAKYAVDQVWTTRDFYDAAVPGKTYSGKIIFIEPVLNMDTRTVNVRVDAANPEFELKPHMFVNAVVQVEVDNAGNVINSDWVGKYICPFHPNEVSSEPGVCPQSKQPLQPASEYGYADPKSCSASCDT